MAILIDKNSRVVVQGITGKAGRFHTKMMLECGTKVVAGVSPGKGGEVVGLVPVYDTVEEAVKEQGANVSVLFLPAAAVLEATIEAITAGVKLVVVVPEHIPLHDMLRIRKFAHQYGARVIGGNTAGVISPGEANVGIMPEMAFKKGIIGTVSRSGSMTYYVADTLTRSGLGESTCVGLGGDPVLGSTFAEILPLFEKDPETKGIVLVGEIGGIYEEQAASVIKQMTKPVVALIGGKYAPSGKRMGHAGAIIEGDMGTAESKIKALKSAGAYVVEKFSQIPEVFKNLLLF